MERGDQIQLNLTIPIRFAQGIIWLTL